MKTVYIYFASSALALAIFYGGIRLGEYRQSFKTKAAEVSAEHSGELAQKWEKRANECTGEMNKRMWGYFDGR